MNLHNNMLTMKSIENILALIAGAVSIVLGYLVVINLAEFIEMIPASKEIFPFAGVKFSLANRGSGFFLLLLIVVFLGLSVRALHKNLKEEAYHPAKPDASATHKPTESNKPLYARYYLSATEGIFENETVGTARYRLLRDFRAINRVQKALMANDTHDALKTPNRRKMELFLAINNLKAAAMLTVWEDDWGDYDLFAKWIREGRKEPIPEDIETAAKAYLGRTD